MDNQVTQLWRSAENTFVHLLGAKRVVLKPDSLRVQFNLNDPKQFVQFTHLGEELQRHKILPQITLPGPLQRDKIILPGDTEAAGHSHFAIVHISTTVNPLHLQSIAAHMGIRSENTDSGEVIVPILNDEPASVLSDLTDRNWVRITKSSFGENVLGVKDEMHADVAPELIRTRHKKLGTALFTRDTASKEIRSWGEQVQELKQTAKIPSGTVVPERWVTDESAQRASTTSRDRLDSIRKVFRSL